MGDFEVRFLEDALQRGCAMHTHGVKLSLVHKIDAVYGFSIRLTVRQPMPMPIYHS